MSKFLIALGALGALALGTVAAVPAMPTSPSPGTGGSSVSCELKLKRTSDGVQLEAWVRALQATSGEYQLIVTKIGPAGSSDVSQGGEFAVGARSATVLGSTEFGLEPRARLKARLILSDRRGRLCEHEIES